VESVASSAFALPQVADDRGVAPPEAFPLPSCIMTIQREFLFIYPASEVKVNIRLIILFILYFKEFNT
jgi:hypothetical protein